MDIVFEEIKNAKIIPENYTAATIFEFSKKEKECFEIKLPYSSESELENYKKGAPVEMFGLSKTGLVYFTSVILEKNRQYIKIKPPVDFQKIQRRKYSRVPFLGKLKIKEAETNPVDLSAGGLKFISDTPFVSGNEYEIRIELENNLAVECTMEVIRTTKENSGHLVSARFKKIRSIDRIALMQYAMKVKSQTENIKE